MSDRKCCYCKEQKPITDFYRDPNATGGRSWKCKTCQSELHRKWRESNREHRREYESRYRARLRDSECARMKARRDLIGNPRMDAYMEITRKHATRSGEWSEQEDAVLATSTDRLVDIALSLGRTYPSVQCRIRKLRKRGVTLARDAS